MLKISQLVDFKRFRDSKQILFLLYLPFGCLLICFRLIILSILYITFLLPESKTKYLISKLIQIAFGIVIDVTNQQNTDNVRVFVTNCVSHFDPFVMQQLTGCVAAPTLNSWNNFLNSSKKYFGYCTDCTVDNLQTHLAKDNSQPLLVQPESAITNGRSLLEFHNNFYAVLNSSKSHVQAVVIQIYRRPFDTAIITLNSNFTYNAIWYLISPCTQYKVRFLEPCIVRDGIDYIQLRHDMQRALNIDNCEISAKQYEQFLATQIGEKSKIMTIISELFTEPNLKQDTIQDKSPTKNVSNKIKFAKDPEERMLSLEERKRQMVEDARRKFIEKHFS